MEEMLQNNQQFKTGGAKKPKKSRCGRKENKDRKKKKVENVTRTESSEKAIPSLTTKEQQHHRLE